MGSWLLVKHLWELGFNKNVVDFFVPLRGFKKNPSVGGGATGSVPSLAFELVHGHALISSSEQPICIIAWPCLFSRASLHQACQLAPEKRERGGTKWDSGFATLSLVTREVLLGAGFQRSSCQLGLLWQGRYSPPGLSPARALDCCWEKALGGDKSILFRGKSLCSQNLLKASGKLKGVFSGSLPSDHVALSCSRNQGSGVLCMFILPGRSTTTNRKSRSVLPS